MKNINNFKLLSDYEAEKSAGTLNYPNVSLITEDNSVKYYKDPYNGYEYVDLGLPYGLKWATCNVGASKPWEFGKYFAWGETVGYTAEQVTGGERVFNWDPYNAGSAASISDDLTLEQDAVYANMGGNWHIPFTYEFQLLIYYCTYTWTDDYDGTGVAGNLFTSNINGKSVFFPAAGYCKESSVCKQGLCCDYWTTNWYSATHACATYFDSDGVDIYYNFRNEGLPVRGVIY